MTKTKHQFNTLTVNVENFAKFYFKTHAKWRNHTIEGKACHGLDFFLSSALFAKIKFSQKFVNLQYILVLSLWSMHGSNIYISYFVFTYFDDIPNNLKYDRKVHVIVQIILEMSQI